MLSLFTLYTGRCSALFLVSHFLSQKEAPKEMITQLGVPDVSSIYFHPIKPFCNRAVEDKSTGDNNKAFPLETIPFRCELDDTHTNFVQVIKSPV